MAKTANEHMLLEMAYPRSVFKDKLEEYLGGALGEFYKAECAKANGLTKWVAHWTTEANRLLSFVATQVYLHPIRGFKDRRKALAEALVESARLLLATALSEVHERGRSPPFHHDGGRLEPGEVLSADRRSVARGRRLTPRQECSIIPRGARVPEEEELGCREMLSSGMDRGS